MCHQQWRSVGTLPVSYTHLDVYKRQNAWCHIVHWASLKTTVSFWLAVQCRSIVIQICSSYSFWIDLNYSKCTNYFQLLNTSDSNKLYWLHTNFYYGSVFHIVLLIFSWVIFLRRLIFVINYGRVSAKCLIKEKEVCFSQQHIINRAIENETLNLRPHTRAILKVHSLPYKHMCSVSVSYHSVALHSPYKRLEASHHSA